MGEPCLAVGLGWRHLGPAAPVGWRVLPSSLCCLATVPWEMAQGCHPAVPVAEPLLPRGPQGAGGPGVFHLMAPWLRPRDSHAAGCSDVCAGPPALDVSAVLSVGNSS